MHPSVEELDRELERLTAENKALLIENTHLKVLLDGVFYIYPEAPLVLALALVSLQAERASGLTNDEIIAKYSREHVGVPNFFE